jgi:wyosine [tRNA(Phe)-imidazoG37] synthetase (radical SAM superfamily)
VLQTEFYGIRSHRCLQMTPVVDQCTHNCLFCWRVQGFERKEEQWREPRRSSTRASPSSASWSPGSR